MKVGDIVINPYVKKDLATKPNPMYRSMIIHIGEMYIKTLRYDGKITKYYTHDVKKWEIVDNVNLYDVICK